MGEEQEDVQEEEEELANEQGDRSDWGLLGEEPRLQMERVSESSSDVTPPPPQASSSKFTVITEGRVTHTRIRKTLTHISS